MARALPICGEYPADWKQTSDDVWAAAGHRCIRCGHPYRKGEHGKGEFTPCDELCAHTGPVWTGSWGKPINELALLAGETAKDYARLCRPGHQIFAQWRIGTVHHFDGNKANCAWYNLLALCQRCHLQIQCRVNPQQPYMFEHSAWAKPYVAGFYAKKYENRDITREQAVEEMDRLLAYERIA